jgi:hypothetical protein
MAQSNIIIRRRKMRDRLASIFNALQNVETKGQSTMILAECMRELFAIIQEMDKAEKEQSDEHKTAE